ncbi:uncharacterized protein LOC142817609 [Rhipicephalus microplus]|uniref:uncharacterized protein LOC142817609 n=1 Tax=Rhipicephalus microplus TaxID=6941 RepID=UPI003F6B3B99
MSIKSTCSLQKCNHRSRWNTCARTSRQSAQKKRCRTLMQVCENGRVLRLLSQIIMLPNWFRPKGGTHTKTETRSVGLREPPPTTAKQFLHFTWVILRLIIKSQVLCSLFSYVAFLRRRDEIAARAAAAPAGGGATSVYSMAE